jgi:hypothetical protein
MPMSCDVRLPNDQEPAWPEACVACERNARGHTFDLPATGLSWKALLGINSSGVKLSHPLCDGCRLRFRARRWVTAFAGYAAAVGGALLGVWLFPGHEGVMSYVVYGGLALAGYVPVAAWELMRPPAFDATRGPKRTTYEFRSERYAHRFAELNDAEVEEI